MGTDRKPCIIRPVVTEFTFVESMIRHHGHQGFPGDSQLIQLPKYPPKPGIAIGNGLRIFG